MKSDASFALAQAIACARNARIGRCRDIDVVQLLSSVLAYAPEHQALRLAVLDFVHGRERDAAAAGAQLETRVLDLWPGASDAVPQTHDWQERADLR